MNTFERICAWSLGLVIALLVLDIIDMRQTSSKKLTEVQRFKRDCHFMKGFVVEGYCVKTDVLINVEPIKRVGK